MSCFRTLSLLILILLCSCGDSPTTGETPVTPSAIDYMFAGNPGTETEYTISYTDTDSTGTKPTLIDTVTWTVVDRNINHPVGGSSLKMHQYVRGQSSKTGFERDMYFSFYNNALCVFGSLTDSLSITILKNPLAVGSRWKEISDPNYQSSKENTVQGLDVQINTTYKTLNTIQINSTDTLFRSSEATITSSKYYYAQGMFLVHSESTSTDLNAKIHATSIIDLIRYTKK